MEMWLADVTFSTAPHQLLQIFSIHGFQGGICARDQRGGLLLKFAVGGGLTSLPEMGSKNAVGRDD